MTFDLLNVYGSYHSSSWIEGQGHRSRLGLRLGLESGSQFETRSVRRRSSIKNSSLVDKVAGDSS